MSGEVLYEEQPTKNRKRKWVLIVFVLSVFVVACVMIGSTILNEKNDADFSAYKTLVGQTTKNEFGQLTLNEVMVDDNQLLLNATFVPAKDVDFNYQIFFFPQVLVNGKNYMVRNGGQTIEQGASTYTIYSSVKMHNLPQDDKLQLDILYNDWNWDKPIKDPWSFEVEASQKQLQEDRKVITIAKTIKLNNGTRIKVEKVVTTPISTTIYYETLEKSNESVHFKIVSTAGKTWRQDSSYTVNEQHTKWGIRYDARYLTDKTYQLIPVSADDSELGPAIQIQGK